MGKTRTSAKQKESSALDEIPIVKVRPGLKGTKHTPGEKMSDPDFIAEALFDALLDGDMHAFKEILKAHYEAVNITATLKKVKLSKRTFYEAISDRGNPRLDTIMKIIHGIALEKTA